MTEETEIRECGPCRDCCTTCDVVLNGGSTKPSWNKCPHENPDTEGPGCLIYKDRPIACSVFECDWKRYGWFQRPHECGVLLERIGGMKPTEELPEITCLLIVETRSGALDKCLGDLSVELDKKPGWVVAALRYYKEGFGESLRLFCSDGGDQDVMGQVFMQVLRLKAADMLKEMG